MGYSSQNVNFSRCHGIPDGESSVVGIHLSGPNAKKSAVVVLSLNQSEAKFISLYEKIGSVGSLFSDERIIDILKLIPAVADVFVDCPISEPPCVNCERPVCPGVVRCEDVAVGMMMAIEEKRGRKGGHKLRPLNPQNLRLWDAMFGRGVEFGNMEPTYSANLAPLVVRARTLQRRLRGVLPEIILRETNVPFLLSQLQKLMDGPEWAKKYRNFEIGFDVRAEVLSEISSRKIRERAPSLSIQIPEDSIDEIASSVEAFHAFMASAMSVWSLRGVGNQKTAYFSEHIGWVDLLNADAVKAASR